METIISLGDKSLIILGILVITGTIIYSIYFVRNEIKKKKIIMKNKIVLVKWKGNPDEDDMHKFDFRWIENKKEKFEWIKKHWVIEEI